jgi:integrase
MNNNHVTDADLPKSGDGAEQPVTKPTSQRLANRLAVTLTYAEFPEELRAWLAEQKMVPTTVENYVSGLKKWMQLLGRSNTDFVAHDLSEQNFTDTFTKACFAFETVVPGSAGKTPTDTTKSTRKSQFDTLHKCFVFLTVSRDAALNFRKTMTAAAEKKGLLPVDVCTQAGINRETASRWMKACLDRESNGKVPSGQKIPAERLPVLDSAKYPERRSQIEKVEDILGLPRTTLTRLCRNSVNYCRAHSRSRPLSPMGQRLRIFVKDTYRLRLTQVGKRSPRYRQERHHQIEALLEELRAYKEYKTTDYLALTGLKRHKLAKWRIHLGTLRCPSNEVFTRFCESYYGYALHKHDGPTSLALGLGTPAALKPSLAWFADPLLLVGAIEFRRARAGGVHSGNTLMALQLALMLTNPETGYLVQRSEDFGPKVRMTAGQFRSRCEQMFHFCRNQREELKPTITMSRDPRFVIQRILDLQHPLEAVFQLLENMSKALPTMPGGVQAQLCLYRDMALIALLGSNPLRASHFASMTYKEGDETSNLYRRDGGWYVRFPRTSFKNFKGAARLYDYDYPVADFATKYLDDYIDIYRQQFRWRDTDLVFLNYPRPGIGPQRTITAMSYRMRDLTFTFIRDLAPYGFGIHAYRHIVATEFIKNQPAGIEVAARVLHDYEETVRLAYRHLKGVDHARIFTAYGNTLFAAYSKRRKAA